MKHPTKLLLTLVALLVFTAADAGPDGAGVAGPYLIGSVTSVPLSDANVRALAYDEVLVDALHISYDPSSPYRTLKTAHRERLKEAAAQAVRAAVGAALAETRTAGPGVLRVRTAITHIRAEQKRRSFWSYTPFGVVKETVERATGRNFRLLSATVEVEFYDSVTRQRLAGVAVGSASLDDEDELSFRSLVATIGGATHRLLTGLARARQ